MNFSHILNQKTNYPFMWREFSNSYLFLSMCESTNDLNIWKIYYSKFKETNLSTLNMFNQINTGLGIEYQEICPSAYRDSNNNLIVTFLGGNPTLDIEMIPHRIQTSNVDSLSGAQATPFELFENIIKYDCIFDSKVYKGVIGDTSSRRGICQVKNKDTNKTFNLFSKHDHASEESIVHISQYNKTDNQFIITLASDTHYRSVIYNIDTGMCRLINSELRSTNMPSLSDITMVYNNSIKVSNTQKEVCLTRDIILTNEFTFIEKFEIQ
jgi:hypothetical protein